MPKHIAPQFELRFNAPEPFRLVQDAGIDYDRAQRQLDAKAEALKASEERQETFPLLPPRVRRPLPAGPVGGDLI